ncbi:PspC domain-containing protein [Williamsia sp. CHRR-6]|uniref:PspC domain-containing protein n=1 Tax=Williamsia sp. CHRR-6 TaxID=2835871 RepID=UPI001BDB3ED9|nr:PspC domain-containing protein [Williamsia sp. CHRR-6]MBT0566770.1 PspC domain-containing protein [Williamsia sp. CHRR-6]
MTAPHTDQTRPPDKPIDTSLSTATIKRMWTTRPVRDDGSIAGVATGIARRFEVDPNVVKVAFVVAAIFGGSGIFVYVLGWLFLPDVSAPDGLSRRERRSVREKISRSGVGSGPSTAMIITLVVIAIIFMPDVPWESGGLVGTALLALAWWLLYRRSPIPRPGTSADTVGQPRSLVDSALASWSTAPTTAPTATQAPSASPIPDGSDPTVAADRVDLTKPGDPNADAWDPPMPYSSAPQWDPMPTAAAAPTTPLQPWTPPQPRRRSRVTPITLGAALLVGAVGCACALAGADFFTATRVFALALTVVSIGLLVGAMRGRGSGLIPVVIVLAITVMISAAGDARSWPSGGNGERNWIPRSENAIASRYELSLGSAKLDLRSVTLTRDRTVRVEVGIGEAKVIVPAGMNVRARCSVSVGDTRCPDGPDGGRDGTAGPILEIDASSNIGHVEVSRG